jgi:hypothetical protein
MVGEDDEARYGTASHKLGQALRFLGELQVAQAVVDEATNIEADLVTRVGLLRVLAAIASGRGANVKARAELERTEDAIAVLERGRQAAAQLEGSGRAPWRLLARLGELYAFTGDRKKALAAFVDALDGARESGSEVGRARVGTIMASFLQACGDEKGASVAREGAAMALQALGDRSAIEALLRPG